MRRPDLEEEGREEETPAVLRLKQSDVFGLWQKRQTPSLNRKKKNPKSAAFGSQRPFFHLRRRDETKIYSAEVRIA